MAYNPNNPNGQATMANSAPVAIASDQSAVPVSAASLPLPTGAATSALQTQPGVDIGDVTINNAAGASAVNIQDGGNSITVDGTVAVTGVSTLAEQQTQTTALQLIDDAIATLGTTTYAEATTKGVTIGAVRRDANTTLVNTTNEVAPLQVNATGELKVAQIQALPAGTNNIGDVDIASIAAGDNNIGNVDIVTMPNVTLATNTPVGNVAHDAVDSGAPIKTGGRARTSDITSVANDDRVDAIFDKSGRQIISPHCLPENIVSGSILTAMTGTTSTLLLSAPGAGLKNYITQITVSNAHATVGTDLHLQDGNGGTAFYPIPASATYGGATITFNPPLPQPTANTALYIVNVTTGASTKVGCVGFKGA